MHRYLTTILLVGLIVWPATGQTTGFTPTAITIDQVPQSLDELLTLRDRLSVTPEGGAAFFVIAMYLQTQDAKLGLPALTIAIEANQLRADAKGYQGFSPASSYNDFLQRILPASPHIARSYFSSTDYRQGYALPKEPLEIRVVRNPYSVVSEAEVKIFVYSTGADSPRPVTLKRNDRGIWKASNASSLFVGVRAPASQAKDTL